METCSLVKITSLLFSLFARTPTITKHGSGRKTILHIVRVIKVPRIFWTHQVKSLFVGLEIAITITVRTLVKTGFGIVITNFHKHLAYSLLHILALKLWGLRMGQISLWVTAWNQATLSLETNSGISLTELAQSSQVPTPSLPLQPFSLLPSSSFE